MKPITPQEALKNRPKVIHPDIIAIVNEILTKKFSKPNDSVIIKQDEIVKEFLDRNPNFERKRIFEEKHLDFEKIFEDAGWKVKFDKPAYCESYDAYFEFSMKKNKNHA